MLRGLPRLAQTVIIMLSARDSVIDRVKSRLVGARDHLSKPFKVEQLVALTREALATLPQAARDQRGGTAMKQQTNPSEIARFRQQIDQEIAAMRQAMSGYAVVSAHDTITHHLSEPGPCLEELTAQVGEKAAIETIITPWRRCYESAFPASFLAPMPVCRIFFFRLATFECLRGVPLSFNGRPA